MVIRAVQPENRYLPVENGTISYWRAQPHYLDEHRSTEELPASADFVIIGTGMSGVATAYHLQQLHSRQGKQSSQSSIVLLEARQTCSGATGRNGGHSKVPPRVIPSLIETHGQETAIELVEFINKNIYALKRTIETENIDCEHEMRRSFDVFLDRDHANEIMTDYKHLLEMDFPGIANADSVDGRFVQNITSTENAKGALSTAALSLWPYKFVTQLLERVLQQGANLQTNTPVISVRPQLDGTNSVVTSRGTVSASKVIFCTNAYTAGLLPLYQGGIVPYKGICSHISPKAGSLPPRLANTYNIHYTPERVDYLNPRPDGGIVVGGGKWTFGKDEATWNDTVDDSTLIEPAVRYFEDSYMQSRFRGWEHTEARPDRIWSGIMGRTGDGLPHIGKVPGSDNQYISAGFNGAGMTMIFLCAMCIAQMAGSNAEFHDTDLPQALESTLGRLKPRKEERIWS